MPGRALASGPALAAMGAGAPVPEGAVEDGGVVPEQDAVKGAGACASGQGLSWPQTSPLASGPSPSLSWVNWEKSSLPGCKPGTPGSGKIHSVTGATYWPAVIWPPLVALVPPVETTRYSREYFTLDCEVARQVHLLRTPTGEAVPTWTSVVLPVQGSISMRLMTTLTAESEV